jgi:hypothetical protein
MLLSSCGGGSSASDDKNVLIPVESNDTYMYVNNRGETMFPEVKVLETSAFYGDYAVVGKEKKGFINRSGKLVVPMQYAEATIISDGLAFVKEKSGATTVIAIDAKGNEVFRMADVMNARRFSEGLAAFLDNKKRLWGFVDKSGKIVIEPQFKEVGDFSCGLAAAGSRDAYGFIDAKGKMVVEPHYNDAKFTFCSYEGLEHKRFTADGYCIVGTGSWNGVKLGVINNKGEFTIPLMKCRYIKEDNGGFIVHNGNFANMKATYIDYKGNILLDEYSQLYPFNGGKYTIAMPDDDIDLIIIDRKGNMVAELDFEAVAVISSFIDGMAVVKNGNRRGDGCSIINVKGEKIIDAERVFVADDYGLYSEHIYFRLNNN